MRKRYSLGVHPMAFLKNFAKCGCDEKPKAKAISCAVRDVESSCWRMAANKYSSIIFYGDFSAIFLHT